MFSVRTSIGVSAVAAFGIAMVGAPPALAATHHSASRGSKARTFAQVSTPTQSLVWPHRVQIVGRLGSGGKPLDNEWAHLQSKHRGDKNWHAVIGVGAKKTSMSGQASWKLKPAQATAYRVTYRASSTRTAAVSHSSGVITVAPKLGFHAPTAVAQHAGDLVKGTVRPKLSGHVLIEKQSARGWKTLASPLVHHGNFHAKLHFTKFGQLKLRAVRRGDAANALGVSPTRVGDVVKPVLQDGDHGKAVLALQKRLRKLHYDIGAVNGDFGYDTFHAVTAFEKVQGLPDNGVVDSAVWAKLANPRTLHLLHPIAGVTAVEVNLTKQVVIIAKNAKIWRIIDSSTAGGYYFTGSNGQSERAVTPEGHFTIQYKITGYHMSDLGELYDPAYFTNTGYAIHGEGEVPAYPASHGCVRITIPAMKRYFNTFYDGESVWIYGNPPYQS